MKWLFLMNKGCGEIWQAEKEELYPLGKDIPCLLKRLRNISELVKNKLRKIINDNQDADFILWNGNRPQIKRRIFEGYIDKLNVI